jgi:predicted metal-dependent phosphotriesterase family hydrolase|tara:strand:- start:530 stop:937 length:408 start_codon:yes stop_codon:yes gene_type:complete
MTETISVDKLVAVYIKMRDKRAELLRDYEEADSTVKAQMEVVESKLLELCKEIGVDRLGSKHGTVMRTVKTRYWTSDWESMHKFILEKKMPELLERRISQTTMKQLLEENPELMPMGLNTDSKYSVTIRRTTSGT